MQNNQRVGFLLIFLLSTCIIGCSYSPKKPVGQTLLTLDPISDSIDVDSLLNDLDEYRYTDPQLGIQHANQIFNKAVILDYAFGQAESKYRLSLFYKDQGKIDSALASSQTALEIYSSINKAERIADCYNLQANLYRLTGYYQTALEKNRKGFDFYRKVQDTFGMIKSWNGMGLIQNRLSNYDSATIYLMKVIEFSKMINSEKGLLIGKINLSDVLAENSKLDNAQELIRECIPVQQKRGDSLSLAISYSKLGRIYTDKKEYSIAIDYFLRADDIYREINNIEGKANIYSNIASCYVSLGEVDKVLTYYDTSYRLYKKIDDNLGILTIYINKSLFYEKQKDYRRALNYYDSSLNLAKELDARNDLLNTYYNIHNLYKKMGQPQKSLEYLTSYMALKDSIFNLEKAGLISDLEIKYEAEKNAARILSLENENLSKDLKIRKEKNRKNMYAAGVGVFLILIVFTLVYFRLRIRKNKMLAEQRLRQAEEERKLSSAQALLEGQEQERVRVSRELHDSIGLLLSTSNLHLDKAITGSSNGSDALSQARALVNKANEDVRRISRGLFPPVLQMNGLNEGVEDLLNEVDKIDGKYGSFFVKGEVFRLSQTREIMVYRILQELINNFLKHSKGDTVDVELEYQQQNLVIHYLENGTGFDFESKLNAKSVGLKSIQSRLTFLNATFDFIPGDHETRIRISIPKSAEVLHQ